MSTPSRSFIFYRLVLWGLVIAGVWAFAGVITAEAFFYRLDVQPTIPVIYGYQKRCASIGGICAVLGLVVMPVLALAHFLIMTRADLRPTICDWLSLGLAVIGAVIGGLACGFLYKLDVPDGFSLRTVWVRVPFASLVACVATGASLGLFDLALLQSQKFEDATESGNSPPEAGQRLTD